MEPFTGLWFSFSFFVGSFLGDDTFLFLSFFDLDALLFYFEGTAGGFFLFVSLTWVVSDRFSMGQDHLCYASFHSILYVNFKIQRCN